MGKLSKTLRFEVLARDRFRCRYCGATPDVVQLHVDHVVPRAAGGSDDYDNLKTSCADCNHGKGDRLIADQPTGAALTPDKRPARYAKARAAKAAKNVSPHHHVLSTGEIDSLDEIDEYDQLALVWCESHQKYEWHNLPQDIIGQTGSLVRTTKPGWRGAI